MRSGVSRSGKRDGWILAVETLVEPAVRSRLADLGLEIFSREQQTPEALGALVKADAEKWWPIIQAFGIKANPAPPPPPPPPHP
jgi:hypothetical protein